MFEIETLFNNPPFSLNKNEKVILFKKAMQDLTRYHYEKCDLYKIMLDKLQFNIEEDFSQYAVPFLPVRLFKEFELISVNRSEIVKTMTSSGTTGQQVSKIYLDKETSACQTKVLSKITADFIGNSRLPMLIIDSPSVIKDRNLFSARGAGILGFSMLGHHPLYALDENMNLNYDAIKEFLDKYKNEKILVFGFTFMIWQYFVKVLEEKGMKLDLSNGIMLHGGGWKKLLSEAVNNNQFKSRLKNVCGITYVHNYYGMVEQTGSIYIECECGRLHCSNYSDIIIRNHKDWSICQKGQKGLIQLQSIIPKSYPGFNLLSEDEGAITGEDDCPCGRKGKTFEIYGRIKNAEVRGCSDTYERK